MDEAQIQELRLNAQMVLGVADRHNWSEADATRVLAERALGAVEELKTLRAEVERLREALEKYAHAERLLVEWKHQNTDNAPSPGFERVYMDMVVDAENAANGTAIAALDDRD